MIKYILMVLFAIFGAFVVMKMMWLLIPYLVVGGGLFLGYKWMDKNLALGEKNSAEANEGPVEEVKEIDVKIIKEETTPIEEPKSLEERIERLKEGAGE